MRRFYCSILIRFDNIVMISYTKKGNEKKKGTDVFLENRRCVRFTIILLDIADLYVLYGRLIADCNLYGKVDVVKKKKKNGITYLYAVSSAVRLQFTCSVGLLCVGVTAETT